MALKYRQQAGRDGKGDRRVWKSEGRVALSSFKQTVQLSIFFFFTGNTITILVPFELAGMASCCPWQTLYSGWMVKRIRGKMAGRLRNKAAWVGKVCRT